MDEQQLKYDLAMRTVAQQADAIFTLQAQLQIANARIAALEAEKTEAETAKKPARKNRPTLRPV